MTRPPSIEDQASRLARWLEAHPGAAPPDGVDPEVLEALWVLRPDLAPPPRVTVDDILAGVTTGPFAPEVVPIEAHRPAPPVRVVRRSLAVAWWSGLGTVAVAALALVVVRSYLPRGVPESAVRAPSPPVVEVPAPAATEAPLPKAPPPPIHVEQEIPEAAVPQASPPPLPMAAEARKATVVGWDQEVTGGAPVLDVASGMGAQAKASRPEIHRARGVAREEASGEMADAGFASPEEDVSPRVMVETTFEAADRRAAGGDRADALALLTPLLEDPSPQVAQEAAFRAASLQLEAGLPTAALATVDRGLARDARATPIRGRLLALRASILEALGRPDEAAEAPRATEAGGTP